MPLWALSASVYLDEEKRLNSILKYVRLFKLPFTRSHFLYDGALNSSSAPERRDPWSP